ncbi:MAG TPA: glycosyl hydrolase family 79 C-terminal domain-containing protein [Solirubrobacteraceae bacterium]|nr:glycosyl hydrolase family 79 C-terminal domain-containing protein [Solirubrobacteraceae bacterium]
MRLRSQPVAVLVAAAVVVGGAGCGSAAATSSSAASGSGAADATSSSAAPGSGAADATSSSAAPGSATVTVDGSAKGKAVPSGFVGLSLEIRGVESFTGTDPSHVNPVLEQLIRNLSPGQRPSIRLGGDSTDWTWYPIPGMARPLGVRATLTKGWVQVVKSLAAAVDARLIIGLNFEVNSSKVVGAEAHAFVSGIGSHWLQALALGNEPELYSGVTWFSLNHVRYYGRTHSWNFPAYVSNYSAVARAIPKSVALAGPDVGGPSWFPYLGSFLKSEPRVRLATIHRYPLKQCTPTPKATISELLSRGSTSGLASGLVSMVRAAHAHGVPFQLDETNSVSCGGEPGVSNTFASSLWSLDEMFQLVNAGVDGVDVHSKLGSANALWVFTQKGNTWTANVNPDYYGFLAFAQAAPAGARLLPVSSGDSWPLNVFATRGTDGTERIVIINMSAHKPYNVTVKGGTGAAAGTVSRLSAPSLGATGHVTLGGQSFASQTPTGLLTGTPSTSSVDLAGGAYKVSVPAASAAIVTLPAH